MTAGKPVLRAGFARADITPPPGTPMQGFKARDREGPCTSSRDPLLARALYLEQGGEEILVLAYDLLFFDRGRADRVKGALGRILDLRPRQILLNASHTHSGPAVSNYYYDEVDGRYMDDLVRATADAAVAARAGKRECEMLAAAGHTKLPVSRRRPDGRGGVDWAPHPEGEVCDTLPVCLLRGKAGPPVCLLFSVSCHPSTAWGREISAEYPGAACRILDESLGAPVSMFLQGAGGDAKARVIADGNGGRAWRRGTRDDVEAAGRMVAGEVLAALGETPAPVTPGLRSALAEMRWPLERAPGRAALEKALHGEHEGRRTWAGKQLEDLDRRGRLTASAPVLVQALRLGGGLRIVALEGEPTAGIGRQLIEAAGGGVTFALGYSNGLGLYLPTERMLDEGGYEVDSFWEYGLPARLKPGYEKMLRQALGGFRESGAL